MKYLLTTAAVLGILSAAYAIPASAADVAGHPRVNEINNRVDNEQNRIDQGVQSGDISAQQAAKDETKLTNTEQKLSTDEAKHKGHITKAQQKNLNKSLNKNSKHVHHQKHAGKKTVTAPATTPAQ